MRMGKGKGSPEYWVACVRPGTILFEAEGVSFELAQESLRLAAQKLPVKTKFVVRRDYSTVSNEVFRNCCLEYRRNYRKDKCFTENSYKVCALQLLYLLLKTRFSYVKCGGLIAQDENRTHP